MEFIELEYGDDRAIDIMSEMATTIVREHYDPIIGKAQNDYMIGKFQSAEAIKSQLLDGAHYYFVQEGEELIGFLSFYMKSREESIPAREDLCEDGTRESVNRSETYRYLYLSKFYLHKNERGKGYSRKMLQFLIDQAGANRCRSIELNVNRSNSAVLAYERLGFRRLREEKNDIGNGFIMDDYVYGMEVSGNTDSA